MSKRGFEWSAEKRVVSYFDHEYEPLTPCKIEQDVNEIVESGFTGVVVTISEAHLHDNNRLSSLTSLVGEMKDRGLHVEGGTWGVANVVGGEGDSILKGSNEKSCMCNPKVDLIFRRWLEVAVKAGIHGVFWDEPEMKCDEHRDHEIRFIEKYSEAAALLGLRNTVCLVANQKKAYQLKEGAAVPHVDGIANDPYWIPGRGNVWDRINEDKRRAYVEWWIRQTKEAAESEGKDWHIWIQNFDIPKGRVGMVGEHIELCRKHLADIAIWGFRGCASAPIGRKGPAYESPETVWSTTIASLQAGRGMPETDIRRIEDQRFMSVSALN